MTDRDYRSREEQGAQFRLDRSGAFGVDGDAVAVQVDEARVDVAPAGDRRGVAEQLGGGAYRGGDRAILGGRRRLRACSREGDSSGRGAVQRAEVLRGEVAAGAVGDVGVDVFGAERMRAFVVAPREKARPRPAALEQR